MKPGADKRLTQLAFCLLLSLGAPAESQTSFELVVGVHPVVSIEAQEVGQILGEIRRQNTACGGVGFPSPVMRALDPSIPAAVDFDDITVRQSLLGTGASILIVDRISSCASLGGRDGCAVPGGPIVVDLSSSTAKNAWVWAHEIGHAQGLSVGFHAYDVSGHQSGSGNLMYGYYFGHGWNMTNDECALYNAQQRFPPRPAGAGDIPIIVEELDEEPPLDPAEQFLLYQPNQMNFTMLAENAELEEQVIDLAFEVIESRDYPFWAGAVRALGYAGGERAIGAIETVLQATAEDLPSGRLINDAKLAAGEALGYAAFQGNGAAVELLLANANPNQTRANFAEDNREFDYLSQQLAVSMTVGIAILSYRSDFAAEVLTNQMMSNRMGAFDLGVSDSFFERIEADREAFAFPPDNGEDPRTDLRAVLGQE